MVNVTFYIDKNNADKNGYSPIKANVTLNYKNITKTVDKVKSQYWNKKKQRVNKPKPHEPDNNYLVINERLDEFQTNAKKYFTSCKNRNIQIIPQLVRDYFNGKTLTLGNVSFWQAYDEYLAAGELELADNTNRNRKTIYNKLKDFESDTGYQLTWETVNLEFWDKLKNYILDNPDPEVNYSYNYLSAIADKFRAFMKWSLKRKYHNFVDYDQFSAPEKEISIIHLTYDELKHLINSEFKASRHKKARDFFCFGCLTGLRYVDLARLTKDNIVNGTIKLTTQKTNKVVIIPIIPQLEKIIDKYCEHGRLLPKISNQKLNLYVKEACKIAEIDTLTEWKTHTKNKTITEFKPKHELIGTHTGRKTFINLAYERGLSIEDIKAITGITQEKTVKRYLEVSTETKKQKLTAAFDKL